jgi:hypothetical protein
MMEKGEGGAGNKSACMQAEDTLRHLRGIVKVERMTDADMKEVLELEVQAEQNVMMGICKGMNLGLRQAFQKRNVFACITDDTLKWPGESYIRIICGDELIGQDIYDEERLAELKGKGELVAGNLVFYKGKMRLFKERREDVRLHLMPMAIPELMACSAVVASPSPPADLYIKKRLLQDAQNPKLGTIIVGVD